MNFDGFSVVDFAPINRDVPGFVYVFCWVSGAKETPFYVGQTKRLWGRLDDYYWAMLSASTDFRVGEAVRYLSAKGYRVIVKYKQSAEPRREEREIVATLRVDHKLINDSRGYGWQNANEDLEKSRVQEFIDTLLTAE